MCSINSHFVNFPLCQLPTLSIPIWSMLTKWELTKWEDLPFYTHSWDHLQLFQLESFISSLDYQYLLVCNVDKHIKKTFMGHLFQFEASLSRMETEQIITWRGGTGSSMQSSVDHIPTSINWLMSSKESKPKLILQLSNLMLDHSHPGERGNTWL